MKLSLQFNFYNLQFAILLSVLLITATEGLFFDYPKKVLSDFIHSLKAKKEAKKKPYENDIQHYHYHYYPIIYSLSDPPTKAPKKYELEKIHNEHLATLGWSSHEYKNIPEPKIKILPYSFNSWKDSLPWEYKTSETVNYDIDNDILVQVPFSQKIVIEHSNFDEKLKRSIL
ncbi:uncharacterized protein LOC117600625 isoform X2 [Osmia lignaria lignaria]|uniref:uncharacterized protein LOC117600625 isoform X2 n=1 Tax=Osmia lignaria lignaria TaxID=1437193 RepID=UPI00402BD4E7